MALWWILIVVALVFAIFKFLSTHVLFPFFGWKRHPNAPSTADVKVSDEWDDGNQTRGESNFTHGDDKQGNASIKGPSGEEEDVDAKVHAKADDFIERFKQQLKLQRLDSILKYKDEATPTSPKFGEHSKGKAVLVEDKSVIGEMVSMSSNMSGPVSQEQEGSDNARYDSTGKLLPINFDKQREQVPTIEENIDVRANIIFLDRDYLEEADPHIPSQQETVSSSASSTQEEESRPEGQNNPEAVPKKRRWFKPFSWWQKK